MKIYQINTSSGQVMWVGTQSEASDEANRLVEKSNNMGVPMTCEITVMEVPLLKPDFLKWLNSMFGGYLNV